MEATPEPASELTDGKASDTTTEPEAKIDDATVGVAKVAYAVDVGNPPVELGNPQLAGMLGGIG